MRMSQVAAQLYTLKGYTEDETQIARALARVRAMGYAAVQVSGLGPISDAALARLLDGEGLVCCATHEPAEALLARPEAVAERLHRLGCRITAYPYPAGIDLGSEGDVARLIVDLDRAGRVLRDAGRALCYHNHQLEFRRLEGRLILERLFDETDPRYLQAELDVYWVQYGGGDPVAWTRRMRGRQPIIHLKDYMIDDGNAPRYADLGAGTLDLAAIVAEAEAGGCRWFAVERDPAPGDPFDSLAASYAYLRDHAAEGA